MQKQGKGQGDRTVLIKDLAESIRQAQQLTSALIKELEKEFNELMTKFRAANAAAKAGASATTTRVKTAPVLSSAAASVAQPKVTRAATTIASSKPTQTAPSSGQLAPVPSTVAWGAINTLIVAASSPKRTAVPTSGSKTPPVTSSSVLVQQPQQQQQQQKSGAVRQLFPEATTVVAPVAKKAVTQPSGTNSGSAAAVVKPVVSYSTAGSTTSIPTTSGAASTRTTPVVAGQNPAPTKPSPQQMAPQVGKSSDKTSPTTSATGQRVPTQQQPATSLSSQFAQLVSSQAQQQTTSSSATVTTSNSLVSSRPSSASPVQDYSPFNNLFSKVAQQSMWNKEQQQGSKSSKNFASVAAAGVSPVPSKTPSSVPSSLSSASHPADSGQPMHVVDAAKAPGYRGNLTATSQSQGDMSTMDLPTSLASSAPGTPIPSSCPIRAPVGSRLHPLTPPPRIGTPPPFNPTPIQPIGPVGTRNMLSNQTSVGIPPDSIMMPPPTVPSLAPGGPSAVRMRPTASAGRMHEQPPQQQQQQAQFDGLPMPNPFYGMSRPSGPMGGGGGGENMRQAPSFPLAPGMGGPPRYNNPSLSTSFSASTKLNPNAPDFATRGGGSSGGPQQGYPAPMFGGGSRISYPPAGYGIVSANGGDMKQHQHMGPNQGFATEYNMPQIGTPFGTAGDFPRMMGYPGSGVANRMSGPPPNTQTGGGLLGK